MPGRARAGVQATILGAGTSIPAMGYSPAGIYVRAGGEHLVFDAGAGTLQRLHALGVSYLDLDRICLTHFHVDHCLDLVAMLFAMRLPHPARTKPLTVYGPPGLRRLYRQLCRTFHGWIAPRGYRLRLKELSDVRPVRVAGGTLRAQRMRHSTPALGYRLTVAGKTLAYSGDTDVCPAVVRLGRGADLLLLECSVTDERKAAGHLTPSECGWIAAQAGTRHLALTHFYPVFRGYNIRRRVRRSYRGPLTLCRDFTRLKV